MSLLAATDLSASLGGRRVLSRVNMRIAAGEVVGLVGANGAGKTTLLRVLAGLLDPESGDIHFDGKPLAATDRAARARQVAYLSQDGTSHWDVTVETLAMMGRLPHMGRWRGASAADREAVARALAACDATHFADRTVASLSGGERARVLLARALAGEPRVLLADEPVAGLDLAHQLDIMHTLRTLATTGAGVAIVMHDLALAARFCDRLVLLHVGRVVADGPAATVLATGNLARCFGVRILCGHVEGLPYVLPVERVRPGAEPADS